MSFPVATSRFQSYRPLKGDRRGLKGDRWAWKVSKTKGLLVAGLGFEPRQADSESAVLPLHNPAVEGKSPFGLLAGEGCKRPEGASSFFSSSSLDINCLLAQSNWQDQ